MAELFKSVSPFSVCPIQFFNSCEKERVKESFLPVYIQWYTLFYLFFFCISFSSSPSVCIMCVCYVENERGAQLPTHG
jgi:hypothetical protein